LIIADRNDPLAERLNSLEDVEEEMPGFLAATREWFRFISCMHYRLYREEELRSGSGSILFF
jgi:inorganic pyrophosphatase